MGKPRINILTPIPFWHPGTTEYINYLNSEGYKVVALDVWSFNFYNEEKIIYNLVPKVFKGFFSRAYKRIFRKKVISKYILSGDIVDIQWCGHYYAKYMDIIKAQNVKIFASLFGSDLYRNTNANRLVQRKIFEVADKIVMGVNMKEDFEEHFPGLSRKILFAQFGSKRLDMVDEQAKKNKLSNLKKKFNIQDSKIVVTIGYSSKEQQQHLIFFRVLKSLESTLKQKLFLILPLTYGVDKESEYYVTLKKEIKELEIDYLCFENRLSDEELVETKLISDITVNLQTTDALSSSIKEAIAAENILLVGKWLPYHIYEELGIYIIRSEINDFEKNFRDILKNLDYHKGKCKQNKELVLEFASWKHLIKQFISNYNS